MRRKSKAARKKTPKPSKKPTGKAQAPARRRSTAEKIEEELADRALAKHAEGKTPTAQERAALAKREKRQEEEDRWYHYRTIPKKHWCKMSGRSVQVLNEQSKRYGFPFGGTPVNLEEVVRFLHDFLAENAQRLAKDGPAKDDEDALIMRKYRRERAVAAELDNLERQRVLLRVEIGNDIWARWSTALRNSIEILRRRDCDCEEVVEEALDECEEILAGLKEGGRK
ncbi:MAG: hypothetical protein ACE5F1_20300 [Planctomycetota bacterium]